MGERTKKTWFRYLVNAAAIALLYGVILTLTEFELINRYYALMMIPIGFNIILAVSLNFAAGFMGQLPLGHAGFMAIGAYVSALFTMSSGLPSVVAFPLSITLGAVVTGFFGVLIGIPALRLKGDYLAIITLGFGEIIRVIILNLPFTGGAYGLKGIAKYTTVPWTLVWVFITIYVIYTLIKSRHGRAILSIREDEIAAEASSISTTFYKVAGFAVSAAFAGVAGGLYAHYLCILDPPSFGFMKSCEILVMVVLGGMGSIIGSVVSATVLTILPELLRGFSQYRMVIYSLLLVIVMIFRPSGLFGKHDFSLGKTADALLTNIRSFSAKKGGDNDESNP